MPLNRNQWVTELLSWHGHDQGGVRVPFSAIGGNPIRNERGDPEVIVTSIISRLRSVAGKIARGEEAPRWIFLVGGPGNGKSESVQEFLSELDRELGCNGALIDILRKSFAPRPLVPWRAEVSSDTAALAKSFKEKVGRLIIVQDASASEQPDQDAAEALANYMLDLVTHPFPLPVFICCANRGLLARSLKHAHRLGMGDEVIKIIEGLIRATSLGKEALSERRPSCWPLGLPGYALDGKVACWPMDMESLLFSFGKGEPTASPVEQVMEKAVAREKWDITDRCLNCDDANLCPFRQNAAWLRDGTTRSGLLKILRRSELAIGQRWNFRDTFSLVAESIVGEWGDFEGKEHPCEWVHYKARHVQEAVSQPTRAVISAFHLLSRLYPHAMFPISIFQGLTEKYIENAERNECYITLALGECFAHGSISPSTYIRKHLTESVSPRLDPALLSPHDGDHILGRIEDAYSQSVRMGNEKWPSEISKAEIEEVFFNLVRKAEEEWDPLSRESAMVLYSLKFLKVLCSSLAKRSMGARMGSHANERYLADYEETIRNEDKLNDLTDELRSLLGEGGFRFNALESFGQPQSDKDWLVFLQGTLVSISPIAPAPNSSEHLPAHDLPFIEISRHSIPLTFDLYVALRLRKDGCASSSLPGSVRAAIDRIRHLHAGILCNDKEMFVRGGAEYHVKGHGRIVLTRSGDAPKFREAK